MLKRVPLITIHLMRKPLVGTVAANSLKYGTGGLNIDGARIGFGAAGPDRPFDQTVSTNAAFWSNVEGLQKFKPAGRWPANLILMHREGCRRVGSHFEEFSLLNYLDPKSDTYGFFNEMEKARSEVSEKKGGQVVEDWECVEDCPVNDLDEMVGARTSGRLDPHHQRHISNLGSKGIYGNQAFEMGESASRGQTFGGDTGGVSHYFKQVQEPPSGQVVDDWECVEDCPVNDLDEQSGTPSKGHYPKNRGEGSDRSGPTGHRGQQGLSEHYAAVDGASKFFKQEQSDYDIHEYLRILISPPDPFAKAVVYTSWTEDLAAANPNSHTGIIIHGFTPTEEQAAKLLTILVPGGHLCLFAPESQPTGHTGAICLEDTGFEIRDAILLVQGSGALHYVAKAARSEREAGCQHLPAKRGFEAVDRKEGSAGVNNPRAGAGRTADSVRNVHPCLHPDALVMTEQGYRPISEIRADHRVYGADGKFHPVENISHHPYTCENLYEIAVQGTNYTTLASNNHPFLIWRPRRKGNNIIGGDVGWVEAQDIRKGDYTMTPILQEDAIDDGTTPEWWWVFGLWLAEGHLQRAGHGANVYPTFSLHEDETVLVERLSTFFKSRGKKVSTYIKGGKGIQVMGFDPEVGSQIRALSPCGAQHKQLPGIVWKQPECLRRAVFEGYMAGDGGVVRTYRQAKTVSPDLASQMRLLGESLGNKVALFRYEAQPGSIGVRQFKNTLPVYQMQFSSKDRNQQRRKPTKPLLVTNEGVNYLLHYVQAVTPVPYEGVVWNLTVQGSPTFQTAVGMSHNTCKPIDIMKKLLHDVPLDEGPVLDPFLGSGTTLIACSQTGHSGIGIEREAEYLRIADARVRYWDRAVLGWLGADIRSDVAPAVEVQEGKDILDLFD